MLRAPKMLIVSHDATHLLTPVHLATPVHGLVAGSPTAPAFTVELRRRHGPTVATSDAHFLLCTGCAGRPALPALAAEFAGSSPVPATAAQRSFVGSTGFWGRAAYAATIVPSASDADAAHVA